ncbi:MAG: PHP domain-containing protein [Clostridia bacterium]|nr:PHP domain-containing protein [Clostridia bacterium]
MYYKIETHLHTSQVSRCAPDSAEMMVDAFVKAGYYAIIVTDHFVSERSDCREKSWEELVELQQKGYRAAVEAARGTGLKVFFAWEMSRDRGEDYLTYGLTPEFLLAHPELPSLSTEEYCRVCREAGGFVVRAHPYRQCFYIPPNPTINPDIVDGIEVVNSTWGHPDNHNAEVLDWAMQHPDIPRTAGTDIHKVAACGTSGVALTVPIDSLRQYAQEVRGRRNYLIIDGRICDQNGIPVENAE